MAKGRIRKERGREAHLEPAEKREDNGDNIAARDAREENVLDVKVGPGMMFVRKETRQREQQQDA